MPQIFIDDKVIEAADGQTVIEAAYAAGIVIPHFCWHPALSAPANCRTCLVDVGMPRRSRDGELETDENGDPVIGWGRKLQPSCRQPIADGMRIRLDHPVVREAQEAVMEFELINHPLDCPICDEAGQCKLQEYAFRHSNGESRFVEEKVPKDKRVPWSPTVLFDAERCISCSRCIRFAEEVAEQPVISFVQRGDKVTIMPFEGTEFDNPYSMNVIDICPVGALTSPDFRFRARVWDMSFNPSVCPGCSRGCNIKVGVRNNEVMRLEPDTNMSVNEYWMCDAGRLTQYKFVNEGRVPQPMLRKGADLSEASWADAAADAAQRIKAFKPSEIMVLGSGYAACEDNYAARRFAAEVLKTPNIDFLRHEDPAFADSKLRTSDRTPNGAGALELGIKPGGGGVSAKDLAAKIEAGAIRALWVLEDDPAAHSDALAAAMKKLDLLVVHAANHNATTQHAHILFAAPTYTELEGTYVNVDKRVQHLSPMVVSKENEARMGMKMSRLDKFGADNDRWTDGERRNCRQSWKVLQMTARNLDADWGYYNSEAVFDEVVNKHESFRGMNYAMLRERRGVVLGQGEAPAEHVVHYDSHAMKPN